MVLVLAALIIFIYGMLASMLGTVVPNLAGQLHLSSQQIGDLALAQGLGLAATSVLAGALMDKAGKKVGILLGLVASVCGLLMLARTSTFGTTLVALAIAGCGGSLVIVGSNTIVAGVRDERKGTALNILNVFVGLGGLATPFVAGNLLGGDTRAISYVGASIAGAALLLTFATSLPPSAPAPDATRDTSVFRVPLLYVLALVTFLYTACEFAMWNWLPKYLIGTGLPNKTALNILSLGFACGLLVGRLIAARVLVRAPLLSTTLIAALLTACFSMVVLHGSNVALITGAVLLTGLCMAPIFPTTIAMVSAQFKRQAGLAIGFAITCGFSGVVVSSPVIGRIAGSTVTGMRTALLLIPVLSLVIAGILLALRPRLARSGVV